MLPSPILRTLGSTGLLRTRGGRMMLASFAGSLAMVCCLNSCDKRKSGGTSGAPRKELPAGEAAAEPAAHAPATPVSAPLPKQITFNEHIQPILSEYCYHCHGPDSGTREPKKGNPLRLDREADAFMPRENGKPVIIKGDPEASLVMKLIKKPHGDEAIMPPAKSHKEMKPGEIALLDEWIRQGAVYEPHWAFAAVKNPAPPKDGEGFAVNPIDRFVAAKLAANGLKPSKPEEARRLFRRLAFDLTGLPPSPQDTDAFAKRHAEDPDKAVAEAADRMLATSASAEHFTRHWLDAARYADTHGIHIDNNRSIWPYRDWVIRAFKENMSFDRFTIEQIAGDMMPDATLDQKVASGFNRCLATTGEGGAIPAEYDAIYAKDRTETTTAVWLGLTAGCAACHDHKFDPVSTKEFYQFTAFFRNTTMSALDGNKADHPPNVFVPLVDDRARWDQLAAEIPSLEKQLAEREKTARKEFDAWAANPAITGGEVNPANLSLHLPLNAEGPLRGTVDGQSREWPDNPARIDGPLGKAPVVSNASIALGDLGAFGRTDQVTYGCFVRIDGKQTGAFVARMDPKQAYRGWDLYLANGRPGTHVIESFPATSTKIVANTPLTPNVWHHVMVTFDGTLPSDQTSAVYVDGVPQKFSLDGKTVGKDLATPVPLRLGARDGDDSKMSGSVAVQDFRFYRRLLKQEEIKQLAENSILRHIASVPVASRTKEQTDTLYRYFTANIDTVSRDFRTKVAALKDEQENLRKRGSVSLVMQERPNSKPVAHILNRGEYAQKGDEVEAGTPAALPPMAADAPKNRIGLAQWLVDPANPLTSRVTMNRTWYYFFGTGLVETTEDFGIMGARPSHPQLLDWLAHEFVAAKWDYRHMVKLIVTSATYRQSESVTPELLEKDPANRLLSRGPRIRLDAEQLRDMALATSGLLVDKVGGPSVKPYQPEGVWEAVAMKESNTRFYKQDKGEALYRRSLYTYWKRTAAPPSMELFNAPTREVFCVRRERTNTPLQALVMLNDPQFVEASRVLATRAIESATAFDARVDFITSRLIGRSLAASEKSIVKSTFDTLLATYKSKPEEAKKLLVIGETPAPATLDPSELAAWTIVSSQILNLDETVTR